MLVPELMTQSCRVNCFDWDWNFGECIALPAEENNFCQTLGVQNLEFYCMRAMSDPEYEEDDIVTVDIENCSEISQPESQKTCQVSRCYIWVTSDWTVCIEDPLTCGIGEQTRSVYCAKHNEPSIRVSDSLCLSWNKPVEFQECDDACVGRDEFGLFYNTATTRNAVCKTSHKMVELDNQLSDITTVTIVELDNKIKQN
eukprot:UN30200